MKKCNTENHTDCSSNSEMTHQQKYRGLIQRSVFKDFRDNLFRYFDYIYTMAGGHNLVTNIFQIIIFVQQCIMALFPFNSILWPHDKLLGRIFTIASVIGFICPTAVDSMTHFIVVLVIYILFLVYFISFFSSFVSFLKMSKVNSFFVGIFTVNLNAIQMYSMNIISSHVGRDIHYIIENDKKVPHVVTLVVGLIYLCILIILQSFFVAPSITFRPQVTHIMYARYSLPYNICMILIFSLTTLGGLHGKLSGSIISLVSIIPAAYLIYISFKQHIWASIKSMVMTQTFSIIFCVSSIVLAILSYFEKEGNEVIILVFIILIFVLNFVFHKVAKKMIRKSLNELNKVSEDESLFDNLSLRKVLALLRFGFDNGHPLCHTWRLFQMALERFPNNYDIVLMYARYAAIYSSESPALTIVMRILKKMKHGSIELKHVLFQVRSLLQHRERGLSKALKKTISKIQDKTEKCRGMIRYTWECVIRGNVIELEDLSMQLKKSEDEILREYNQLCLVYPNNPYVAAAFSHYLLEIMCNEKESAEKQKIYRMLRSGAWTRTERSYFFAIRHIPMLPSEEQHKAIARPEKIAVNDTISYASSVSGVAALGDLNDGEDEEKTQKRYIESMVNSVRLPTSRYGAIMIIFTICVLVPVIALVELVFIYLQMNKDKKSLNIIKSSAMINMFMSHIAFYALQSVLSPDHYINNMSEKWNEIYIKVDDFKNFFYDKKPYIFLGDDSIGLLNNVEYLRYVMNYFNNELPTFASSGFFDDALNFIFNSQMITRSYNDTNDFTYIKTSMENIVTFTQNCAIQVATKPADYSLNSTSFWSIIKNAPEFYDQFDEFDLVMIKSIQDMLSSNTCYTRTFVMASMIPGFIIALLLIIYLTYKVEVEKRQIFKSFKAIPKAAVSAIVQRLNSQSGKESNDVDENIHAAASTSNAQEENALRVLSTAVDHGLGWIGRSWKIIAVLVIFSILSILCMVFLCLIPEMYNDDLIQLAPLYHQISSIHTKLMLALVQMSRASLNNKEQIKKDYKRFPIEQYPDNQTEAIIFADKYIRQISDAAHILRYGSEETRSQGIPVVSEKMIGLLSNRIDLDYIIPKEDIAIIEQCSYDVSFEFIQRMFSVMVINIRADAQYYYPGHTKFSLATIFNLDRSYMQYVLPSYAELDDQVAKRCNSYSSNKLLLPMIIFIVIMILCGIVLIPLYQQMADTAQWTVRLLLFCEPNVILQSKVILKILSNDFSRNTDDDTEEKSNFYESVVSHLLDGVIFMSNDLVIRSANNAIATVLGKDPRKVIGMKLHDLFKAPPGNESSLRSFYQAVDGMMNCMRSPSIEAEVQVLKDNEPITLLLSMNAISATGEVQIKPVNSEGLAILVLSIKDMTATVVARTLLQEENAKNENLLSMILPPIIVRQLQKGESNICFPVQSASIVFMDIVSFTPWCGSNTAAYVMSTLNKLFLYFDTALKKLDKMTKIKCIGDCYMCAGGIFDEVNQPAEHAKQAITFGLEAIKCVERIDVELNEKLRIRVGCNTGGPIVAGVLGIEKPTFDILGPDINLAAMMEHHGVPMNVHIPQHVYDLGVYNYFVTKERGDVDVKGKMYHTFVITGYANQ